MPDLATSHDTDRLVARLARDAGQPSGPVPQLLRRQLWGGAILGYAMALIVVLLIEGPRPDLPAALATPGIYFKWATMGLLALYGLRYAVQASLPGQAPPRAWLFAAAAALTILRIATDSSGQSWLGVHTYSFAVCVATIVAASLLPLALLIVIARHGASTSPARSGAACGLLAGALGAAAWAWACRNDAGLFLLVWYPVALSIVTALGAAIGRRLMRW